MAFCPHLHGDCFSTNQHEVHRVCHHRAAQLDRTFSDFALRLIVGCSKAERLDERNQAQTLCTDCYARHIAASHALFKGLSRCCSSADRGFLSAAQPGDFISQPLLRVVNASAFERFKRSDFFERQIGEETQEPPDIAVIRIAPILPEIEIGQRFFVEPNRACRCLAHLCAACRGDERRGQSEKLCAIHPAAKFNPVDDIAPLIRAAHLQAATMVPRQHHEIIGLKDHIVEFKEGERLFAFQPQLDRIKCQHTVDGEVRADRAEQIDIAELTKPIMIVDHDGVRRAITKGQEAFKNGANGGDVGGDGIIIQHPARFILARWVTNPRRSATHHNNRLAACLLKAAEHHDRHQAADVERRRRRVKPDIARNNGMRGQRIERFRIGCLMDITPFIEGAQKIGLKFGHDARASSMGRAGLEMFLNAYSLLPHPDAPPHRVRGVSSSLSFQDLGHWQLSCSVDCEPHILVLPPPKTPARRDGLWRTTCFELFVKNAENGSYCEFNFSPSGEWAAYAFDGYRAGMMELPVREPRTYTSERDQFLLAAAHFYPDLPPEVQWLTAQEALGPRLSLTASLEDAALAEHCGATPLVLGISAVIEEADGTKSYWALAHPAGPPDFHHADCFAQKVAAPDAA